MGEGSNDNAQKVRDALVAILAPDLGTNAVANVDAFIDSLFTFRCDRPQDSNVYAVTNAIETPNTNAAALASTHTLVAYAPCALRVVNCNVIVGTNAASADTNYATFSLVYNDGAGGADTTVATLTTQATGGATLTAGVPQALTINASNAAIAAGKCVQVKVTKSGTGRALPSLSIVTKMKPSK